MSDLRMDELGRHIYGVEATQMIGGASKKSTKKPVKKVKKVKTKKTKGGSEYEVVGYPEYCSHEGFKKFMHFFYLYKVMSHSKAAAIFVIPPKNDLNEMIRRFQGELKKEGLIEFSEQAIKWAAVSPCEYKRYIFDIFADADPTNYRLANEPAYKNFGTIKRTNRLKEQYYFKYIDAATIKVVSEENDTEGETLKLVAKATASQIFIFEGNLPECKQKYTQTILLTGGANDTYEDKLELYEQKQKLLKKHGAYKFVCTMAHYNDVSKDFSADIQHTAFSILFDPNMNRVPNSVLKKHELNSTYKKLVMNMKLLNSKSNYSSCQKTLAGLYQNLQSEDAFEASESYIDALKSYYKKAGGTVMLKADVATNMWRNGYAEDYDAIFEVAAGIDEPANSELLAEATKVDFTDDDRQFITSKLCSVIHSNLCSFPFIGLNARNYYPNVTFSGGFEGGEDEYESNDVNDILLVQTGGGKKAKKVKKVKKTKKGMKGGDDDEDDQFEEDEYDDMVEGAESDEEDDEMKGGVGSEEENEIDEEVISENAFVQGKVGSKKKKTVKKSAKAKPKKKTKKGMKGGDGSEDDEIEYNEQGYLDFI